MLNIALATNLLILSNDVAVNTGPFPPRNQVIILSVSLTEVNGFVGQSVSDNDPDDVVLQSYFDLQLDEKRIRMGHWNVNHLTLDKFDQIK